MENNHNFAFFILSMNKKKEKEKEEEKKDNKEKEENKEDKDGKNENDKKMGKVNLIINVNNNDTSYEIIDTQKKISFDEEYLLLIIKIKYPFLKENEQNFIEIKYKDEDSNSFGNKIKLNKNQFFYFITKLFPLKNENISILPQLNLTYSEEFLLYMKCFSDNLILDKENILKENLLLNYKDESSKEISFEFLLTIFSLCIELNIPPFIIIGKDISFENYKNDKIIKFDFFQNLMNVIDKNENKYKSKEKLMLKISQIECHYYYIYNNDTFIDLLKNKNKYILNGLISLIAENKINYKEIFDKIKDDSIMMILIEEIKDKKEIEKIIGIENDFLKAIKIIYKNYNSFYQKYKKDSNKFTEPISLPEIDSKIKNNNEEIEEIILVYNNIIRKDIENNIEIINYNLIFKKIFQIFNDSNLMIIEKLWKNLISLDKDKENVDEQFHNLIVNLGKSNKLSNKEVILILTEKDKFYFDNKYIGDKKRNPDILISFNLNEEQKLNNFNDFKDKNIWKIFNDGNNLEIWTHFIDIFIDKINNIYDFLSLYELIPFEILSQEAFCDKIIKKILKEEVIEKSKEMEKSESIEKILYLLLKIIVKNLNIYKNPSDKILSIIQAYSFITKINNNEEKIFLFIVNSKDKETQNKNVHNMLFNYFQKSLIDNPNKYNLLEFIKLFDNKSFLIELLNNTNEIILNEEEFYYEINSNKINYFLDSASYFNQIIQIDEKLDETKFFKESNNLAQNIFKNTFELSFQYNKLTELLKNKDYEFYNKIITIFKFLATENQGKERFKTLEEKYEEVSKKISELEKLYNFLILYEKNSNDILKIKEYIDNIKFSNLSNGLKFNLREKVSDFDVWKKIIKNKNSIFFISVYQKFKREHKNKSLNEIFDSSLNLIIISFNNLIEKKDELIEKMKEGMEIIFQIIENNKLNLLLNDLDYITKDCVINKQELKNLVTCLSLKNKIIKYIKGIFWILDKYNKFINFKYTLFYDKIKEIYSSLDINKLKISILNECITFLKNNEIFFNENELNEEQNLFSEFINLISGQYQKEKEIEEKISFCINKNDDEIKNIIETLKDNECNFLNKNDIKDFKDCCHFINGVINEKIDEDKMLLKVLKDKYYKDKSIYYKFKNYFGFYKNIDQFFKNDLKSNKSFNQIIQNILNDSEILIKKNEIGIICTISYQKENELKETLTLDELIEIRDNILLNSINENNNINNVILIELINNINKLFENYSKLNKNGYPYNKEINLKILDGNIFSLEDSQMVEISDTIKYFDDLFTSFKDSQLNYCKQNPMLRFIYGKLYILLFNRIVNSKDPNLKEEINHLLKYISNNNIQEEINDFKFENENKDELNVDIFFKNISNYLEKTLSESKSSFKKILDDNLIKDDFNYINGQIFFVTYPDKYLENTIINIYNEITGNYPINNTILICNEELSFEKIYSFLLSFFLCESPVLFTLINIESLKLSERYKILNLIEHLNSLFNNRKSALLILGKEDDDSYERTNLIKMVNNISKNKIILLEKKDDKEHKYKYKNVKVITSSKSGFGKSSYIKYHITKELKKKYIYFPIGGTFTREAIIERLKKLKLEKKENYVIHLDLHQTDLYSLLREFLFKLLILKVYDINDNVFYMGNKINFIIELPFGFTDYIDIIPFLNIFTIENINYSFPLRLDSKKGKIKDSNIQIVSNILKLFYENKIGKNTINLSSEALLSEEECQNILNKCFEDYNIGDNYYQKMMFVDFLAVQFKMFTECITLLIFKDESNYNEKEEIISKARSKIISAIINSAMLAVSGPFNKLIDMQNKSFKEKINFSQIKYENKNKNKDIDTINYDSIKGCLFFFNEDKQYFTIITNNPSNDDYDIFLSLNDIAKKKLIDYGNLTHEKYLEELRKIFNLPQELDIKELAKKNDQYAFTRDNFIKMILIYYRIKSNIPVILMGETGCGKTSLIKMLSLIINKGKDKLKIININEGVTDKDIIKFIKKCQKEVTEELEKEKKSNEEKIWILFDEINTCNSLGLISEIMIKKSIYGEKINDNFIFIGTCNPYRIINKKMKQCGLIYQKINNFKKDENINKTPELIYNVNPLPLCLINFIFNLGNLTEKDEKEYASSIIEFSFNDFIKSISRYGITNIDEEDIKKEKIRIVDMIIFSQNYLKNKFDNSLTSIRDIKRFTIFYEWFLKHLIIDSKNKKEYQNNNKELFKDCLNLSIYFNYYLRISDLNLRKDFGQKIGLFLEKDFLEIPLIEEKNITELLIDDKEIVLNRMIRENLLSLFICINTKEPIIIVGKPGSGKTLSINYLANSMKGDFSENNYFKRKDGLIIYRYQGTDKTTSEDIINIFKKVRNSKEYSLKNIPIFLFEEMGVALKSKDNPLKILNYELECEKEKDKKNRISFVGISNWSFDSAKMNRVFYSFVPEPSNDELIENAINIANSSDKELSNKYDYFFCSLAKTYYKYKNLDLKNELYNNFHGNRDFYFLIKDSINDLIENKNILTNENSDLILTKIGIKNIERNFGGLPEAMDKIKNIFRNEFSEFILNEIINYNSGKYIEENIKRINNRYLMIINDSTLNEFILFCILKNINKNKYKLIKGSPFILDINYFKKGNIYKNKTLGKIRYLTLDENILIMKNLDSIYPFLFNLFNRNYKKSKNNNAYINNNSFFEINEKLKIIVLAKQNNLKLENLPFINRFEKHIISIDNLLKEEYLEIKNEIYKQLLSITSFNHNKKLKVDLLNMLLIKDQQELGGMIYKIIYNLEKENKKVEKEFVIKKIYEILTPTFSQDLIISLKYSGFEKKNKKLCSFIYETYKKASRYNLKDFFNKMNKDIKKYIIYTFSNVSNISELYKNENNTDFNFVEEIVGSIKSEEEIDKLLNTYYNSINSFLILHYREEDIDKLEYITYKISQYEADNSSKISDSKYIIFIVHLKRKLLKEINEKEKEEKFKNEIQYHNFLLNLEETDDKRNYYEHIFIDNLLSKDKYFIDFILERKNDYDSLKSLLNLDYFIEKYIYIIFTYFSYSFFNENQIINKSNYIKKIIIELTKFRNDDNNNEIINYLKEAIKKLIIKESSFNINNIIPKIYVSNAFQENDIDCFEILKSYIYSLLKSLFLYIVNILEKYNFLSPILLNLNNDINISLYKDIISEFFNTINIYTHNKPKEEFNSNPIDLILGLTIPGDVFWFKEIKNKFLIKQNIIKRYQDNDNLIRKINYKKDNNELINNDYNKEYDKLINNLKEELKKSIYINKIISCSNNNNIKKELIYDYIKIYISELSKQIYEKNSKHDYTIIFDFILILLSFKFNKKDENINNFIEKISSLDSEAYLENFSSIILFLESYNLEILSLAENFNNISTFIPNMKEKIKDLIKLYKSRKNNKLEEINEIFENTIESIIKIVFLEIDTIYHLNIYDFYKFFEKIKYIKIMMNKICQKLLIYNDTLISLEILILIYQSSTKKNNEGHDSFQKFIINVMKNLNNEIKIIENKNYNGLSMNIITLLRIIENRFGKDSHEYCSIASKILRIQYIRVNDESFKYLMMTLTFQNDKLIIESLYFFHEIFKFNDNPELNNNIKNHFFDYFLNEKENKYLLFLENVNTDIFNEVLLYYLETQFNQYFFVKNYNSETNFTYLAQTINYLDNYICDNNLKDYSLNNLKKLFSIAYIKVFLNHFSSLFIEKDKNNNLLDNIKKVENLIKEKDNSIRKVIIIYFYKCIYHNNFDNIIKLNKYINNNEDFPFKKDYLQYLKEIKKEKFTFVNCFIPKDIDTYMEEKKKFKELKENSFNNVSILNYDYYNKNGLDSFYCIFVNHLFSETFDLDKNDEYILLLEEFIKEFENNIIDKELIMNKEYKEIFKSIYNKSIIDKIKEVEDVNLNEIEILLYGLRFVLSSNSQENYYSLILQSKCDELIDNSYVPGAAPNNNIPLNSYYELKELMPRTSEKELGFYICSCGQYYTLGQCTLPYEEFKCQNCGLTIGGFLHYIEEREGHFRLFYNEEKFNENEGARDEVIRNKIPYMYFKDYKAKYIDQYLNEEPKGIKKEEISFFVERKINVIRSLSELSYRILNFILYSHLFAANIIGNISEETLSKYTPGNFSCFKCLLKDWEIINDILKEKNINSTQQFINIIFNEISSILKECPVLDTSQKRKEFEERINKCIEDLIKDEHKLNQEITKYRKSNEKIKSSDPSFIDEIILEGFPPIELYYPQLTYPEYKYFMKSVYPNNDIFYKELCLIKDYSKRYPLLYQVLLNNEEFRLMPNAININKLCNKLLNKYSYKITRDYAKSTNLFSLESLNDKDFKKVYFEPFISSWNNIKKYCTRYLCRPEMPVLTINENTELNYFLVDDGELGGGMYLSSAYTNFIEWQNIFINFILDNINQDSNLFCYSSQLNQEIYIQDATKEEILQLDDEIQNKLNDMLNIYSIRNIFTENIDKINYMNYKRIKFNFEQIELDLANLVLTNLKRFKSNENDNPIKFITYLYEGYRSKKSDLLLNYEFKYPSRELNNQEQKYLFNFMKANEKDRKIMNEFLSSCQILIDFIQKENYNISSKLSEIIKELPYYLELNEKFKNFFNVGKDDNQSIFTVNTLLNVYKIFEHFCWKETKENINEQYKEKIENNKKVEINSFFKNYNEKEKLIKKKDLASALRRLISRYLAGKRGDTDIKEDQELIQQITRNDLWEKNIIDVEDFQTEIYSLTFNLKVSQAYEYLEILGGDSLDIFDTQKE